MEFVLKVKLFVVTEYCGPFFTEKAKLLKFQNRVVHRIICGLVKSVVLLRICQFDEEGMHPRHCFRNPFIQQKRF